MKLTADLSKKCAIDETSILKELKFLNFIKPSTIFFIVLLYIWIQVCWTSLKYNNFVNKGRSSLLKILKMT